MQTKRSPHRRRMFSVAGGIGVAGGIWGRRSILPWLLLCAAVSVPSTEVFAAIDAASVQRSIDRGIAYLRKTQNARGGWEEYPNQSCGLSALCTLALMNAGVPKEDADMVRAMRYLRGFEPNETYSVSLQTLVYCQLGAAGDLPRIRRNVQWLVQNQRRSGDRIGSWTYGSAGVGDPSNTQFAILALGAAEERGIEVEPQAFELALQYWLARQHEGGGWGYSQGRQVSGSMTSAGIASIIIARGRLGEGSSKIVGDKIACCGDAATTKDPVAAGLEWLGRNFNVQVNPGGAEMTHFYYMYALERVGRLSGRRFIGEHDWYREGAQRLVDMQDEFLGFWAGSGPMESSHSIATSFALLFLSKGKRQVVVGRLQYADKQNVNAWQPHPDSLRQLVRHLERDWGRDLTWQTIAGDQARLEDLLQAPVLVISGSRALELSPNLSDRLKQYIDQGGTILFDASAGDGCGDARGFEASVRQLCQGWFDGATLDRLPPDHPVWFAQHKVDPTVLGADFWMYGVQACCRTSVFYAPRSLSCRWELSDVLFRRSDGSEAVRRQIDAGVRIGENVIAYATGRELKDKLDASFVIDAAKLPDPNRGAIPLAMLALDAGGQEARRALPNAAALIGSQVPILITAAPQAVGFDLDQLRDTPFLWIHGRTDFSLDSTQRQVLREYLETGGVVLGSAVCGNPAFADAFRREFGRILPESPLRLVPGDHPVLRAPGGFDISNVTIRTPDEGGKGVGKRLGSPRLEVATVDNLAAVFFSPLDLSCALESPNSVQCPGYSTEDAAKIVANLVLFALQQ